jgi:hypothetical protein
MRNGMEGVIGSIPIRSPNQFNAFRSTSIPRLCRILVANLCPTRNLTFRLFGVSFPSHSKTTEKNNVRFIQNGQCNLLRRRSSSGRITGRDRSIASSMSVKIAAFAPMPMASVRIAVAGNTGDLRSCRSAKRLSCQNVGMLTPC